MYKRQVWYKLTDRTRAGSTISIVGAAITLVCLFALIPSMGYMGAAWATLICYASMAAISYAWGQKHYPVPYNVTRVLGYMAGAAVLWYISLLMSIHRGDIILVRVLFLTGFLALVWRLERTSIQS